jgi:hypothetical protein
MRDDDGGERYTPLPARILEGARELWPSPADPAHVVLLRLTGRPKECGPVLVMAPPGRGKTALLREVVHRSLRQFEACPSRSRLPVWIHRIGATLKDTIDIYIRERLLVPVVSYAA